MAVTAHFTADVSVLVTEMKKAEGALDKFESEASQAGKAVTDLGAASTKASGPASELSNAYKQFDGVLSAAGVNIGPAVKGIEDIATASGKSAAELGKLATSGLVAGAAITGWNIGRAVSEFLGLDKVIGDNVSALMGWGDVAGETAGAVQDTLAKASQEAGRSITDMTEAVNILTAAQKAHKAEAKENAKANEDWAKANAEVVIAAQNHVAVLNTLNPKTVDAAKFALDHGVNQKSVATAYQLSASEIAAVIDLMEREKVKLQELEEADKKRLKAQEDANREVEAAFKKHGDALGAIIDEIFGMDALQSATTWTDVMKTAGITIETLSNTQLKELYDAMQGGITALTRSGQLTSEQSSEFTKLALAADEALKKLTPVVDITKELAKAQWDYALSVDETLKKVEETTPAIERMWGTMKAFQPGQTLPGGKLPSGISRVQERSIMAGGLEIGRNVYDATTGALLAVLERKGGAGGFLGWGYRTSADAARVNNIIINGSVLSDPDRIAAVVGDALAGHYGRSGNRLPV